MKSLSYVMKGIATGANTMILKRKAVKNRLTYIPEKIPLGWIINNKFIQFRNTIYIEYFLFDEDGSDLKFMGYDI